MGRDYYTDPLIYLITILFSFYAAAIVLRFLLQWVRADFYNPISQFLVKITNPPLIPLRRILPGWGGIDIASILLAFAVIYIKLLIIITLKGYALNFVSLIPLTLANFIELLINIFLFTIFIHIILSWIAPHQYNPIIGLIRQLAEPLLKPARRILPPMSGIDFSPIVAIIFLTISKMLLLPPLQALV